MSEYVSDKMSEEGQNLRQMERQRNCRVKCKKKQGQIKCDKIRQINCRKFARQNSENCPEVVQNKCELNVVQNSR